MKSIFTLTLLLSLTFISKAQNFIITFDDTAVTSQYFYTDSTLDSLGIWQIGVPNKPIFDSAYSWPNAIVTELDTTMPVGVSASFIISVPDTIYYPIGYLLTFTHKYDFDYAKGGGYVEFSVDSGMHWYPICPTCAGGGWDGYNNSLCVYQVSDFYPYYDSIPYYYGGYPSWWGNKPTNTIDSYNLYFTGTDSNWVTDTIILASGPPVKTSLNTLMLFRFTAFTNSGSVPHEGWMIDNINFQPIIYNNCPGGINEINSSHIKVYPDPVVGGFTISLIDAGVHEYSVAILDLMGRPVLLRDEDEPEVTLSRAGIAAGSYVVKVTDKETGTTMEKQVVFE